MTVTSPPGPGPDGVPAVDDRPARADGVELLGEVPGSGYRAAPSLVRRPDGQVLQLTPLLYAVLSAADGERDLDALAAEVGRRTGKQVGPETLRLLVSKLEPLGVLRQADGATTEAPRSNPLLGLRFKVVVSDPERTRRITAPFSVLFRTPVVVVGLLAFAGVVGWLLLEKGLASATSQAFESPGLLLLVVALTVVSAGFHEFGHAAACRYGGATPGAMGAGLYLVWPAFYTEVSDSYRLGRWGRLRVDLGGLWFNALVALAVFAVWAVTRYDALLLLVLTQVVQMVRQLAPLVRFDGYHVLADLTGVPDLYARIGPTLRGVLPWNWGRPENRVLKPWARAVVTAWVLVVVPLLLGLLVLALVLLPRILATTWAGLQREQAGLAAAWSAVDPASVGVRLLSMVALALPALGIAYLLGRIAVRIARGVQRWSAGSPPRRAVAAVAAVLLGVGLAAAWWPDGQTYRPITATERLTVVELLEAAAAGPVPGAGSPAPLAEGTTATATTVWASGTPLPTRDDPALALVLVPRDDPSAPTWVFPFTAPPPPGEGDNQALAVNTEDGSTLYDVSFSLVWAEDGATTNVNEAYAFASCAGCTTVAVAFQVVLVLGESPLAVPQNLAQAVNHGCLECVTYALASQLVLTLPDGLSDEARAQIEELWAEVVAFEGSLQDVPLSELQSRLEEFKARIVEVVERDAEAQGASSQEATTASTPTPSTSSRPSLSRASPSPAPTGTSGGFSAGPSPAAEPSSSPVPTAEPSTSAGPTPTSSPG